MTTVRTLMLLAAGLGAVSLAGCGADVPEHPNYETDVRPILVARCIRCHNANENGDPEYMNGTNAIGNFDYASFGDFGPSDKIAMMLAPNYIQSDVVGIEMPPPPAAKLADWQIETIKRFVSDNKPSQ